MTDEDAYLLPAHRFDAGTPGEPADGDAPHHPPNYRKATERGHNCKSCEYDTNGHCRKYDDYQVAPGMVCDSFMEPAPPIPSGATGDAEGRKKGKKVKGKVVTFDFDETITKQPNRMSAMARLLKDAGCEVVIVTGNESPTKELEDRLNDEYDFPFDKLIQYHDDETDGAQRAEILKQLDAWLAFDDRAGRAPVLCTACPHLFLFSKPSKENLKQLKKAKSPKKVVKDA